MTILVFNCGSSSIKYQLFEMPGGNVLAKGLVQRIGEGQSEATQQAGDRILKLNQPVRNHHEGLEAVKRMLTDPAQGAIRSLGEIGACGHRVVHGGEAETGSVVVDEQTEKVIEEYADLAPLHNPPNLVGIREARKMMAGIPQVACFDTAFHQTIPRTAFLYAFPQDFYAKHRIRKYGFHGTSHQYVARRAAALLQRGEFEADLITCHLGNGCSMAAVKRGKCVDTTMGFTPLEGLVMGTRTGDFDPAIVLHLLRKGYPAEQLDGLFNKKSGLLGLSGISNDVRDLEEKAQAGKETAALALEIFAYRIKKYIGAYLAVMNGADAVVFTGGIGENGARMRARILAGLDNLGIGVDESRNAATIGGKEGEIQSPDSRIKVLIVPTNEEYAIAQETYRLAGAP
jgi:acetate kinase